MCGENIQKNVNEAVEEGSPPRVRGKLKGKIFFLAMCGITPACAGKTGRSHGQVGAGQDHPRVCGENTHGVSPASRHRGSPPRVRGKLDDALAICPRHRITPACAGKTASSPARKRAGQDHPRVCGENKGVKAWQDREKGSPPRVRGKPPRNRHSARHCGITPACAGKTKIIIGDLTIG